MGILIHVTPIRKWIPAFLLVALTLLVFGTLRDFGPESALRKFHIAAANDDFRGMAAVSAPNSSGQAIEALRDRIAQFAILGARYEVLHVTRRKEMAVAEVGYVNPRSGAIVSALFVLKRRPFGWQVDPEASIALMEQAIGARQAPPIRNGASGEIQ